MSYGCIKIVTLFIFSLDAAAPSSLIKDASSCDATNKVKTLKWPTASLKSAPLQIHSNGKFLHQEHWLVLLILAIWHVFLFLSGAAGPAGIAETSTSCDALSRVRALRTPRGSLRAPLSRFSKRSIRGKLRVNFRYHETN